MNKWPELGSYPDALSVCFWVSLQRWESTMLGRSVPSWRTSGQSELRQFIPSATVKDTELALES